jgi:nephrocystin-3
VYSYLQALSAMQKALEIRQTSLDPDHPSVAQVLHEMAGVHAHWGRLVTAETLYREALEIYESAYGINHCCVAREMESLAFVYHKLGK